MRKRLPPLPALASLAAALGFALGHLSSKTPVPQAPARTAPVAQTPTLEPTRASAPSQGPDADRPLSNKEILHRLSSINVRGGNWRQWSQSLNQTSSLLSRLSLKQFPELLAGVSEHDFAASILLDEWTERDPDAALAWVTQKPDGSAKLRAMMNVATTIARRDPQKALLLLDKMSAPEAESVVRRIFRSWGETDPATASAQVATLPSGPLRQQAASTLVAAWARKDPQAALDWVSQLPPNEERQNRYAEVFENWGEADPKGAIAFVEKMPEGPERVRSVEGLGGILMRKHDPSAALNLVDLLPPGEKQDQLLSWLTTNWAISDPEKARDWAKLQTDEHVRTLVWPAIVSGLAAKDPAGAAALALSLPENNKSRRSDMLSEVANRWANQAPAAAADYFLKFPESPESKKAVTRIADVWARNDADGATRWLSGLSLGGKRDAALEGLVSGALQYDPAKAGSWAMNISDPGTRERMLTSVAQTWMRNDPEAATRWISQPAFPAELRAKIKP